MNRRRFISAIASVAGIFGFGTTANADSKLTEKLNRYSRPGTAFVGYAAHNNYPAECLFSEDNTLRTLNSYIGDDEIRLLAEILARRRCVNDRFSPGDPDIEVRSYRIKSEFIKKLTKPAMVADVEFKNLPASIMPGHITYIKEGEFRQKRWELFFPEALDELVCILCMLQLNPKTLIIEINPHNRQRKNWVA